MILCNWYLDTDRVIKGRLLLIKNVHALNSFPHDQSVLARLEALLLLSFLENVTCILDDSHPLLGKARLFLFAMLCDIGVATRGYRQNLFAMCRDRSPACSSVAALFLALK